MKKLIAISVVFALVLGAAFAQPNLGGNFQIGTKIIGGESKNALDETVLSASGVFFNSLHMNASFGDSDAGGLIRFYHNPAKDAIDWKPDAFAFVWWRPVPQVRVQLGQNPDGDWGHDQIAGWGFDAEAKAVKVAQNTYGDLPPLANTAANSGAWGPGFNGRGLTLSLFLIDGLQINFAIPGGGGRAEAVYSNIFFNVSYALEVGTVRLSAQFRPGDHNRYVPNDDEALGVVAPKRHWRGNDEDHQPMDLWAAFHLTAIDGLGAELGLGFTLPYTTQDAKFVAKKDGVLTNVGGLGIEVKDGDGKLIEVLPVNTKVAAPVRAGLGVQFGAGDFNVKARAGFNFAGSQTVNTSRAKELENQVEGLYKQYSDLYASIVKDPTLDTVANQKKLAELQESAANVAATPLYLDSATFYQKYTTGSGVNPWVARSGYQEKRSDPFVWGLNLLPSFKLGNITAFLGLGIGMKHYAKQEVITEKRVADGTTLYNSELARIQKLAANASTTAELANVAKEWEAFNDQPDSYWEEKVTFEGKPGIYYKGDSVYAKYPETAAEKDSFYGKLETVKLDVDWYVNPYVQIPAGGGSFYAGFKLFANGDRIPVRYDYSKQNADLNQGGQQVKKPYNVTSTKYQVKWEIPIGFNFYF